MVATALRLAIGPESEGIPTMSIAGGSGCARLLSCRCRNAEVAQQGLVAVIVVVERSRPPPHGGMEEQPSAEASSPFASWISVMLLLA